MPPTMPCLFYYLDPTGEAQPLRVTADGLPVRILDRSDVQQACQQGTVSAAGDNIVLATPSSGWQMHLSRSCKFTTRARRRRRSSSSSAPREVWRVYLPTNRRARRSWTSLRRIAWKGRNNQPLIINLGGANSIGYSVQCLPR